MERIDLPEPARTLLRRVKTALDETRWRDRALEASARETVWRDGRQSDIDRGLTVGAQPAEGGGREDIPERTLRAVPGARER